MASPIPLDAPVTIAARCAISIPFWSLDARNQTIHSRGSHLGRLWDVAAGSYFEAALVA